MTRPPVRDGTVGLNGLMLLFGKLAVTPAHDPHRNFQSAKVPVSVENSCLDVEEAATPTLSSNFSSARDLDEDVEMVDAFEAPYLRPAGLPTWLTDYGYSWSFGMLNHVDQDVKMVNTWDIDP
ncbi:hypothetical protein BU17DRAFT_86469 [Hysterangium stoloniferum]|nr:hypothetical protein BU17DRAFT_86469 [Hysterangium stoloniferum]